jgi:F5/8 type C domain
MALPQVEPARTWRQIQAERISSRLSVALPLIAAVIVAGRAMFTPPNVARGKPVRMSSERPGVHAADGVGNLTPAGVVDGRLTATYDVCTKLEPDPWVEVDLQAPYDISKVIVFNRGECCWGERELPMVVEGSLNRRDFAEIGRRAAPFTQRAPWVLPLAHARARYVRVRVPSHEPRELVLSEVEVYGRPATGTAR